MLSLLASYGAENTVRILYDDPQVPTSVGIAMVLMVLGWSSAERETQHFNPLLLSLSLKTALNKHTHTLCGFKLLQPAGRR